MVGSMAEARVNVKIATGAQNGGSWKGGSLEGWKTCCAAICSRGRGLSCFGVDGLMLWSNRFRPEERTHRILISGPNL